MSGSWWTSPADKAKANPGKHETFVFGQQAADGTACIGCDWQTYDVLDSANAVKAHDDYTGLVHDCSKWLVSQYTGLCPCGSK